MQESLQKIHPVIEKLQKFLNQGKIYTQKQKNKRRSSPSGQPGPANLASPGPLGRHGDVTSDQRPDPAAAASTPPARDAGVLGRERARGRRTRTRRARRWRRRHFWVAGTAAAACTRGGGPRKRRRRLRGDGGVPAADLRRGGRGGGGGAPRTLGFVRGGAWRRRDAAAAAATPGVAGERRGGGDCVAIFQKSPCIFQ